MSLLANKVVVIAGASAGIGRAAAFLFSRNGGRLVINARGGAALAKLADEIVVEGGQAIAVPGDVVDEKTHRAMVDAAITHFGRLDIALNNAGHVGEPMPLADVTPENWQRVIDVNLTAAYLGARHQIPAMLAHGGGSIIFTSSFVGTSAGIPGMTPYGAAKAALSGLVKGITADYGGQGIRANTLLVGGTETALAGDAAQREWAAGLHAMKRLAQPEEIAKAALFLASDMSSFVAGASISVDGGNAAVK